MGTVTKTDYELKEENECFVVYKNGVKDMQGWTDKESMLHAIWVTEGKVPHHFYAVDDKCEVSCIDRGCL